jgi:ectoine hydroxylase-related dioxygenase (phytanoyl-CoA dioxygenase family)
MTANADRPRPGGASPSLEQQAAFFHTFGALRVPGLFTDDIGLIVEGFEEMFRDVPSEAVDGRFSLHRPISADQETPRRQITEDFIERNPKLAWLKDDSRVTDLVRALLGEGYVYAGSSGNLFNSYIHWHSDFFRDSVAPETHIKLAFYLDHLDGESGALRVMPGTNHPGSYRMSLYEEDRSPVFGDLERRFGLDEEQLPCWAMAVSPGDLVVFNDAVMHANFKGRARRRMFSLQFEQVPPTT